MPEKYKITPTPEERRCLEQSEKFHLHLKECEYRFNLRKDNVYAELLKPLRRYPL